jgi:hypothetical protein
VTLPSLVADDPVTKVQELKQEVGNDIWLVGGGELASVLYAEIDQLPRAGAAPGGQRRPAARAMTT